MCVQAKNEEGLVSASNKNSGVKTKKGKPDSTIERTNMHPKHLRTSFTVKTKTSMRTINQGSEKEKGEVDLQI